jgi:putative endonuclease
MEVTVYILRCRDGSYYTGLTKQSIEARLWEHNAGVYDGYTARRRPVELVFMEVYDRILDAIARERQIKGWNRQKKEALIAYAYRRFPICPVVARSGAEVRSPRARSHHRVAGNRMGRLRPNVSRHGESRSGPDASRPSLRKGTSA